MVNLYEYKSNDETYVENLDIILHIYAYSLIYALFSLQMYKSIHGETNSSKDTLKNLQKSITEERHHAQSSSLCYANFHLAVPSIGNNSTIDCLSNHPTILRNLNYNLPLPASKVGKTIQGRKYREGFPLGTMGPALSLEIPAWSENRVSPDEREKESRGESEREREREKDGRSCGWLRSLSWNKSCGSSPRMLSPLAWISFQDRIKWCCCQWRRCLLEQGEREQREEERKGEKIRRCGRENGRGEKNGEDGRSWNERERDGNRDRDVPAGKQMVAPFIGLFVGSAITSRPAIRPAGVPLCIPRVQDLTTRVLSTLLRPWYDGTLIVKLFEYEKYGWDLKSLGLVEFINWCTVNGVMLPFFFFYFFPTIARVSVYL
mgnify:CR=1 FL=1